MSSKRQGGARGKSKSRGQRAEDAFFFQQATTRNEEEDVEEDEDEDEPLTEGSPSTGGSPSAERGGSGSPPERGSSLGFSVDDFPPERRSKEDEGKETEAEVSHEAPAGYIRFNQKQYDEEGAATADEDWYNDGGNTTAPENLSMALSERQHHQQQQQRQQQQQQGRLEDATTDQSSDTDADNRSKARHRHHSGSGSTTAFGASHDSDIEPPSPFETPKVTKATPTTRYYQQQQQYTGGGVSMPQFYRGRAAGYGTLSGTGEARGVGIGVGINNAERRQQRQQQQGATATSAARAAVPLSATSSSYSMFGDRRSSLHSEIHSPSSPYSPSVGVGQSPASSASTGLFPATTAVTSAQQERATGASADGVSIVNKYRDAPFEAILAFLMLQPATRSSVTQIAQALDWQATYEEDHGDIKEFISSYHAIFLLSPMSDTVQYQGGVLKTTTKSRRLKPTLQGTNDREERVYSIKRATNRYVASKKSEFDLGSVAYTAVCNRIDLATLADVYRRRNLHTQALTSDCLLIQFATYFDLFVFSNGAVVWWGVNRSDHWIVEDDFLTDNPNIRKALSTRYPGALVNKLFPEWLTYSTSPERVESLSEFLAEEFEEKLNFDHFYLPRHEDNMYVRAAISHALAHAAKLEVFEDYVQQSSDAAMDMPQELTQTGESSLHTEQISMLIGDLQLTKWRFGESIEDVPIFFWDYPRLTGFFERARDQFNIDLRVKCFYDREATLTTGLNTLRIHRHRLHMIKSEHVLIIILALDMLLLLSRLCITLFFVEPTKEQVML